MKTYQLLIWLLRHTRKFRKDQGFVLTARPEKLGLVFHDALLAAARTSNPRGVLAQLVQAMASQALARNVSNPIPGRGAGR